MIYPIVAYGNPVLRKQTQEVTPDYPELKKLVEDMFETMLYANGVGLAAPQINLSIKLAVIDLTPFEEYESLPEKERKLVLINPEILEESGEEWSMNEGCLSFPGINEDVVRKSVIRIRYQDLDFQTHEETFDGMKARVTQHEYDHLNGKVFVDRINSLKKVLLKRKLEMIAKGQARPTYKMSVYRKK